MATPPIRRRSRPCALMKGVRFFGDGVRTHSVVMQSQPARIRFIDTIHIQGERALVRF